MSQPEPNPHTQRSVAGMIGSMIVIVILVLVWFGFRSATSGQQATPIQTVDWKVFVTSGRADHALLLFAPDELPRGWVATSVNFSGGNFAQWHLGMLTSKNANTGKYVAIEESLDTVTDLVKANVDENAVQGRDVRINGQTWQTWTDSGGDFGLARAITAGGRTESVLVYGAAPDQAIKDFTATLKTGTVRPVTG